MPTILPEVAVGRRPLNSSIKIMAFLLVDLQLARGARNGAFLVLEPLEIACSSLCATIHGVLDTRLHLRVVRRSRLHKACDLIPFVEQVECPTDGRIEFTAIHFDSADCGEVTLATAIEQFGQSTKPRAGTIAGSGMIRDGDRHSVQ